VATLEHALSHACNRRLGAGQRQEPQRHVVAGNLPFANRMRVAPIREGPLERETFAFRDLLSNPLKHEPSGANR
jgi:hypothetical protein